MTKVRVVVEVLDNDGEPYAGCSRDDCRMCDWARQSSVIEVGPGERMEDRVQSRVFAMAQHIIAMNDVQKKDGWPGWD